MNQHSLPKLCCLQRTSVCCRKCVVSNESAFTEENYAINSELVFAAKIVLSTANSCSLSKVRCLQGINVRCQNCVVSGELVFAAEIVLSIANSCSLPKVCCLQGINVRCRSSVVYSEIVFVQGNCVVFSESAFAAKIVLFAANEHSLPKVCLLK